MHKDKLLIEEKEQIKKLQPILQKWKIGSDQCVPRGERRKLVEEKVISEIP